MSEAVYEVGDKLIRYSDTDNEFPCLCTFPKDEIGLEQRRSLFVFGCTALLILKGYYDELKGDYIYIPQDVPLYILDYARSLQMMTGYSPLIEAHV